MSICIINHVCTRHIQSLMYNKRNFNLYRHGKEKQNLKSRINDLENELAQIYSNNQQLQQTLTEVNEKFSSLSVSKLPLDRNQLEDTSALKEQVEQLQDKLSEQEQNSQTTRAQFEQTTQELKSEIIEITEILKVKNKF